MAFGLDASWLVGMPAHLATDGAVLRMDGRFFEFEKEYQNGSLFILFFQLLHIGDIICSKGDR